MSCQKHLTSETGNRTERVLDIARSGQSVLTIHETLGASSGAVAGHLSKLGTIASTARAFDLAGGLGEANRSTVQTSGPREAAQGPRRVCRVLLADDHHINHLTIQAMLEDHHVEIVAAFDGAEAVEKFKAGRFDRVLMDIDMPRMDGMSAVRAICAFEHERGTRRTPIAMFSALSGRAIEEEARQAGADSYLTKPITLNQLYAFVDPAPPAL